VADERRCPGSVSANTGEGSPNGAQPGDTQREPLGPRARAQPGRPHAPDLVRSAGGANVTDDASSEPGVTFARLTRANVTHAAAAGRSVTFARWRGGLSH